jgi:alpha-beta hydrolase superfamily lysophospholipase
MNLRIFLIGKLNLAALIMCIACSHTTEGPDTANISGDRHYEKAHSMGENQNNQHDPDQLENNSMQWHYSAALGDKKATALVIHGLNLRPSRMESIIETLAESGIDVLNLSLRGHGQNYDRMANKEPDRARLAAFKAVTYQLWMEEVCSAYKAAKNRSDDKEVPLFLIGYSLGGLLGADLMASEPGIHFDKMVLFAPAMKMHYRNNIIRVLAPFPRLTIPSFALASYQSNDGTPMAGYNALFDSLNNFAANIGPKINVPTLIFIDEKDEIVCHYRLQQMVRDENLDQWQFYIVQKQSSQRPARIHHLIIDEPSTGEAIWRKMMAAMVNHLYH